MDPEAATVSALIEPGWPFCVTHFCVWGPLRWMPRCRQCGLSASWIGRTRANVSGGIPHLWQPILGLLLWWHHPQIWTRSCGRGTGVDKVKGLRLKTLKFLPYSWVLTALQSSSTFCYQLMPSRWRVSEWLAAEMFLSSYNSAFSKLFYCSKIDMKFVIMMVCSSWHSVHSHCCVSVTTFHLQNTVIFILKLCTYWILILCSFGVQQLPFYLFVCVNLTTCFI